MENVLRRQALNGLPPQLPRVLSEYGYSAFAGRPEVDLPGALLDAETAAQFLTLGGTAAYLYGYEPAPLQREVRACDTWGNLALWQSDGERRVLRPLAALHGVRLLTGRWLQPGGGRQVLYAVRVDGAATATGEAVTAYAARRPDGRLAVLLINKDPRMTRGVDALVRSGGVTRALEGPADLFSLSAAQYVWHPDAERGYARPDRPPAHRVLGRGRLTVDLPPSSLCVLRARPG
jgi:hypothetical protein